MATTIQISQKLKQALDKQKLSERETYEEVLWDLLEDRAELSDKTLRAIREAEKDVAAGRTVSLHTEEEVRAAVNVHRGVFAQGREVLGSTTR